LRARSGQRLGHQSASIGTIGLVSAERTVYGSLTTPDPIALHKQLERIAGEGVTHLAFGASSHWARPVPARWRAHRRRRLHQSFARPHDYHPDVAHYFAAKLRLFRDLVAPGGAAVISRITIVRKR